VGRTPNPKQTEEAAEYVELHKIHPWDQNPRNNAKAIREVMRSIQRFGFAAPIIARKQDGEIIAGHTRYEAAKRLHLEKVPVRFLDISKDEAHVLALADNRIGEIAEWNDQALRTIIANLDANGVALDTGTGFQPGEIDKILGFNESHLEFGDASITDTKSILGVIIECESDTQQRELLERFNEEGLTCRALM
jgi:ParB-like chromosome segregation protein Spo0J